MRERRVLYSLPARLMIGIDEHTIHKARTFATTIADLTNRRIYDVIEGKSRPIVEKTLMSYKHREKVTMRCMDLSSSYRRLVGRCFPNAKVVADRFHVIRMIQLAEFFWELNDVISKDSTNQMSSLMNMAQKRAQELPVSQE